MSKKVILIVISTAFLLFFGLYILKNKKVEPLKNLLPQITLSPSLTVPLGSPQIDQIAKNISVFTQFLISKNGTYGLFISDLKTGKEYSYNSETLFNGASLYKLPVIVAMLHNIQTNKYSYNTTLEYLEEDMEGGTGSIQSSDYGTKYTIETLINLALKNSDNVASNILQRNQSEKELVDAFYLFEPAREFYINNNVSPYQLGKYFETLFNKDYLNKDYKEFLLSTMSNTSFDNRINQGLDPKFSFSHKIGSAPNLGSWHDCGLISESKQNLYIVCLMSKNATETEFLEVAKNLGKLF